MKFEYSYVVDLVYHMLAHMQVENASNLYSEEYISKIREVKGGNYPDIRREMESLEAYYNAHFESLCMINFIPFNCPDMEILKSALDAYPGFSPEDREFFIEPFWKLLKQEEIFYKEYRGRLWEESKTGRDKLEAFLKKEWEKYQSLVRYFHKEQAMVTLSYSMTCNGRGFVNDEKSFKAAVPYAWEEEEFKNTFLQALHEFTHQFTDCLLQQHINMNDGSHNLSEFLVILFDYYLIKNLHPTDIEDYLLYISKVSGNTGMTITEEQFLQFFDVGEEWKVKLQELAEAVAGA